VHRGGRRVGELDDLATARARCQQEQARFYAGCLRFDNPHQYPVGLELGLHQRKLALIEEARRCPV
jgi:nicotinate phosphoribosyltransferase